MYEYKYVSIETGGTFWSSSVVRHQTVIDREAKDGWRYVGFIPTEFTGHGGISSMDLIFERPIDK